MYSQEQIDRANQVNLVSFLQGQGEQLVRSGKEYRWKKHDSVTVHGNHWFRFSRSKGGYPIDFVMEFWGLSFPDAVEMLINEKGNGEKIEPSKNKVTSPSGAGDVSSQSSCPIPSPDFHLPVRNVTEGNVIKYLTEERGIDSALVDVFIAEGSVYEDEKYHNVVFVGRDATGLPRYAHCRGTTEKFRQDVAGSDKSFGFSYQGKSDSDKGKQLFVFEAPIDMLSFINLFPKDWQERSYVSLGGVAGKAMVHFLSEHPEIETVFLCLDSDQAGDEACLRLVEEIPEQMKIFRLMPTKKDWNEILLHKAEYENNHFLETIVLREVADDLVPMIKLSEVEPSKVEWLWDPYIPMGKITILQGDPGMGKTFVAMQIAAACTNGVALPDSEPLEPFNVIYQTAEDGLGDTVQPRLIAAGADLDKVMSIDDSDGEPLTLVDDRLEKAIIQNNARLLIIDPVQAFLGQNMDMNRATDVRYIFKKLGFMAARTGCAVLLIGHLNKCQGMSSSYRGLGSVDFRAAARSVLVVGCKKNDRNYRALAHDKSSLGPTGSSQAYALGDEEGFRWLGKSDVTPDELLSGVEPKKENKTAQAKSLIAGLLAGGKEVFSKDLDAAAMKADISTRTLRDAKKELGDKLKYRYEDRQKIYWME